MHFTHTHLAWAALVALAPLQTTAARPPVDFSGTWTMTSLVSKSTPTPRPEATGVAALPPSDEVVRQSPGALEVERAAFGQVIRKRFTFDGAENTNKSGATILVTHSRWVGKTLVTEGQLSQTTSAGYDEWRVKETRSLTAAGVMVVETEQVDRDNKVTVSTKQFKRKG